MSSSQGLPDRGHSFVIHTLLRPTDANCEFKKRWKGGWVRETVRVHCFQSILIRLVLLLILYDLDFLWDWQSVPHSRESAGDDGDDGMMMDDGKLAKCRNYLWNPWVVDVDVRNLRVFILPVIDFFDFG